MTTIAYRDGIMASDSRAVIGGWKQPYAAKKLFRMADGTVCAVTGDLAVSVAFVKWLDGDRSEPAPSLGDGGCVIHLGKDHVLTFYEGAGSFQIAPEFGAWGSGGPAANVALYMGADAAKAVEMAALVDDSTGGDVVTMACETMTEEPKPCA